MSLRMSLHAAFIFKKSLFDWNGRKEKHLSVGEKQSIIFKPSAIRLVSPTANISHSKRWTLIKMLNITLPPAPLRPLKVIEWRYWGTLLSAPWSPTTALPVVMMFLPWSKIVKLLYWLMGSVEQQLNTWISVLRVTSCDADSRILLSVPWPPTESIAVGGATLYPIPSSSQPGGNNHHRDHSFGAVLFYSPLKRDTFKIFRSSLLPRWLA